ncbi:Apoptosis regulatory protein Siva [Oopsacas minuta]|uniref:Apoptosis regulatory protein Siva n=1 Tax=Oopsacas minuta TaxID=111878 RepID=A0AAV7K570_9METZ|nr:Apoptosis regulatory protein Siva [Oopsacas minuta]
MRKRKADSSSSTQTSQCKTHLGFKEMASEEDWNLIYAKTQQMLISNAQGLYKGEGVQLNNVLEQNMSPISVVEEDKGYKQSSLLDHFKLDEPCTHKHKQDLIPPPNIEKHTCTYCLKSSFSPLSICGFCERKFCPQCLGRCSRCVKLFCSVCSQMDYSDNVDERLMCFTCISENI